MVSAVNAGSVSRLSTRAGNGPSHLAGGLGGGVDRDLGVGDLLAVDGEDAEAEAVVALGEHLPGG